ncbi:hypothetical protein MBLNU457_g2679t1 [Dothideomycetes sp. NU457]
MPSVKSVLASAAALAASVAAQSPAGYTPSTFMPLGVSFNGDVLLPSEELPQAIPDTYNPSVFSPGLYLDKYMLLMVDLKIPYYVTPYTEDQYSSLVPGLGANRTTRLHWWQTNVTHNLATGAFEYDSSTALAPFAGPQPPPNDTFHDYTIWLFPQPRNFVPPAAAVAGEFQDPGTTDRFNFSLPALAAQVGNPIAANYFRCENAGNEGAPTVPTLVIPGTSISVPGPQAPPAKGKKAH